MKMNKSVLSLFILLLINFSNIFAQNSRPVVSEINTISKTDNKIKITWKAPENSSPEITGFIIYKDSKQITSSIQLSELTPVAKVDAETFSYIDSVNDYRDYYYCIICSTKNGSYTVILPAVNSTVNGIKTASSETKIAEQEPVVSENTSQAHSNPAEKMRDIPLPAPALVKATKNKQNILGPKAMAVADELGNKYSNSSAKINKLFVFECDLISPEGGDDYYLFKILKNTFVKKNFSKSINELSDFLSIHRDEEVTQRAIFYLGESYYFSKNYEKAVFQFLQVQDKYPELCKKWIDSCLDLIQVN